MEASSQRSVLVLPCGLVGDYDNGSSKGAGRTEYLWLPTEDGGAIPAGIYGGSQFYAIHSDHLGTPRLMTNEVNKPVWQWPYSSFGSNKPTGILKATANPKAALTNRPVLLQATAAPEMNLGFPGQMRDVETGAFYNYLRTYDSKTGRYLEPDPSGLDGGLNQFLYGDADPLTRFDPEGLETIYNVGPVRFVAYPGPPATDFRPEHGAKTGAGHHIHTFINGQEGPRVLTSSFKVYPGDEKLCTGPFKDAIDKLKEGEKQYLRRAQMQIFNDKKLGPRLQNVRARLMLPRLMGGTARGRE